MHARWLGLMIDEPHSTHTICSFKRKIGVVGVRIPKPHFQCMERRYEIVGGCSAACEENGCVRMREFSPPNREKKKKKEDMIWNSRIVPLPSTSP